MATNLSLYIDKRKGSLQARVVRIIVTFDLVLILFASSYCEVQLTFCEFELELFNPFFSFNIPVSKLELPYVKSKNSKVELSFSFRIRSVLKLR